MERVPDLGVFSHEWSTTLVRARGEIVAQVEFPFASAGNESPFRNAVEWK